MVEISTVSRGAIYEKQNITVTCDTGFNYFAEGMQWAIRWKNQSLKFFPTPCKDQRFLNAHTIKYINKSLFI
jgi:hypothetical protein